MNRIYLVGYSLLLSIFVTATAFGQLRSATLTGKVTDSLGGIIPNAEVQAVNADTGVSNNTVTNEAGEFNIPYLQAGRYNVIIKPPAGFSPFQRSNIEVGTSETARVDVTLEAAGVGQLQVDVLSDAAAQLQTEKTDVNSAVNELLIKNMPNINHNPLALTTLLPNTVGRGSLYDQSDRQFGIGTESRIRLSAVSINGGAAFSNDIQLDGVSVQGSAYNEASVIPNTEGLQEVRVISNNFSSEYGRGQGIITLVTKSGTNDWHGSAFVRMRNEGFNANDFTSNLRGDRRKKFRPWTYGGTIGGPIYLPNFGEGGPSLWSGKNRAFFFLSYEGLDHLESINIRRTVPTARERVGDFSQTYVNVNSSPQRVKIFDPFNVSPVAGQEYLRRAEIPNAVIPNPDPYALFLYSHYPMPNIAPEGEAIYNRNNYFKRIERTFERNNINSRIDFQVGNHSIYTTFGIQKGQMLRPRSWNDDNIFDNNDWNGNNTSDDNPYGAVGATLMLSPTFFVDARYGINRRNATEQVFRTSGLDFNSFGIPREIQAIMPATDYAPDITGTGPWAALSHGPFRRKQENATNHAFNASATKTRKNWTFKFGGEYRVYLSNYEDFKEGSVEIGADGGLVAEHISTLGAPRNNDTAVTWGFAAPALMLGVGRIHITPGFNVRTAFAQKYLALYTQNDWKATDRLTINLGLRWDLQPGPTDRYDRISSLDMDRRNPFGGLGYIAFAGADGYSRNLWDTKYTDFGPRVGAAYRLNDKTVIRGGYGITYLPSNTGFFAGPSNYGMGPFTTSTDPRVYGIRPNGVPVGRWNSLEVNRIIEGTGSAQVPQIYGSVSQRFDRKNWVSGRVHQWNLFAERSVGSNWLVSAGYSAAKGSKLPYSRIPLNSIRYLPESLLNEWAGVYRQTGEDPGDRAVTNPYNPTGALPFSGAMASSMIPQWLARSDYAMFGYFNGGLGAGGVARSIGNSDYHAGTLRATRRLSAGWQFDTHYTWSKAIDNAQSEAMGLIANETIGFVENIDPTRFNDYRKLSVTDVPHRLVVSFVYELPFSNGGRFHIENPILRNIVGGWRIGGAGVIQSGFPFEVRSIWNGSLNNRPSRVPGVPLELPESYQRWYTGTNAADRTITLPSGRPYEVCHNCYLKYNPDAFVAGRVIPDPKKPGFYTQDRYWFGDAAFTYNDLRTDMRHNWDISLSRIFSLGETARLEIAADATNVFNRTQFLPGAWGRDLGGPNVFTMEDSRNRLKTPFGYANNSGFGAINPYAGTYSPRQIELRMKLAF